LSPAVNPEKLLAAVSAIPAAFGLEGPVDASLGTLARAAVAAVAGSDAVSVALVTESKDAVTRTATDDFALALDALQYELGSGPSLTVIQTGLLSRFAPADEHRWPEFSVRARALGLGACLSAPIVAAGHVGAIRVAGALNLYSRSPDFGPDATLACLFAASAGLGVAYADAVHQAGIQADQLTQALASRDTIGQAKGILMAREGCTPDQAFDMLRRASQRLNEKLRVVAEQVVQSVGEDPGDPGNLKSD
jgi:hypothetical protein